jgi:hypothetical protein
MINSDKVGHQWCRLFVHTDASILCSYFNPTLCIDDLGTIMVNILYYRQMLKVPG